MKDLRLKRTVVSALMLALGITLPFLTAAIPQFGRALLPMHLPILLCGFICGWEHGLCVGFICPLLRYLLLGAPVLFPDGLAMSFELATYGFCAGLLYGALPKKLPYAYVSLVFSMLAGRVVWGVVSYRIAVMSTASFGMEAFLAGAFFNAVPGIILQIVAVPPLVVLLKRFRLNYNSSK